MTLDLDHVAWCHRLMDRLMDGGAWAMPRSALAFQKRGNALVLVGRMAWHAALPMDEGEWKDFQDDDYATTKEHFEAAGYEVRDENSGSSRKQLSMKHHVPVRPDTLIIFAFIAVVAFLWGEDILRYFLTGHS